MDVDEAKDDGDVDDDGDEVEEDFILGKVLCFIAFVFLSHTFVYVLNVSYFWRDHTTKPVM